MVKCKKILSIVAVLLVFLLLFSGVNRLFSPKYATRLVEGSMICQYYGEAHEQHDLIFIGDCEVYANFSPLEMYRNYGITAYVRGSSQQLIWQSYYILEETLTYETPKAVVFNVNAMRYGKPVSEAYNRLTIDNMRWSRQKIEIIKASMMEEESFLSYVFPILRYHSRFDELTAEDIQYFFKNKANTWNGYLMNQNVVPVGKLPAKRVLADYRFGDVCYDYLERMTDLCKRKGIELILVKAPSLYPYWYEEYDAQILEFAKRHNLSYYNFTDCVSEIGLDYQTDTYDAGLHLNLNGAMKLSNYFGEILAEKHNLEDHRNDSGISQIYNEKLKQYDDAIHGER